MQPISLSIIQCQVFHQHRSRILPSYSEFKCEVVCVRVRVCVRVCVCVGVGVCV
jgi:hypothetical protein